MNVLSKPTAHRRAVFTAVDMLNQSKTFPDYESRYSKKK